MTKWMYCALIVTAGLVGCGDDKETETGATTTTTTGPTATGDGPAVSDVQAAPTADIATVLRVTWTTDEPSTGYVEFGAADAFNYSTPMSTEPATEHEALLLGMPSNTDVGFRVVATTDAGTTTTADQTVPTGPLPNWLPTLTVEGEGNDQFFTLPVLGQNTGATIISPDGNFVWYHQDERDLDVYRVRLSRDGESVIYNAASVSGEPSEASMIVRVSLDGATETTYPVSLLAHDFVEMPDGAIVAIVVEYRDNKADPKGEPIRGDQLLRIAPDGTQEVIWSAWDCYDPSVNPGDELGWTFANALDYDAGADAFYLSLSSLNSIVKIDRESRECLWALGGDIGTVEIEAGSNTFLREHQFHVLDDGIVIFDNDGPAGLESRVIEYSLDQEAGTAAERWSYNSVPPIYNFVLGDTHRFDNGDTLIVWSVNGQIDRVNAAGEVTWKLNTALGNALGFTHVEPTLYVGNGG